MLLIYAKVYDCGFEKNLAGINVRENPAKHYNSLGENNLVLEIDGLKLCALLRWNSKNHAKTIG